MLGSSRRLRLLIVKDRSTLQRLERCVGRLSSLPLRCSFSSVEAAAHDEEHDIPKQPFVTAHLEPGEWDVDRTDPYFRPKPPRQSKLISAEDFANRPPVAFEGQFATYSDAMVSLGWLDQKTCRQMYQIYVDMMVLSQGQHQKTSHEYVTRVIAQKFNLTPWRAAGIVQLQHAEEQMRQHSPELLCDEQAKYAEQCILQNIRDAYRAERSQPPQANGGFMEDPVGIHGRGEADETSRQWTKASDIYDLEQKMEQATVRDAKQARLLIDGHVYKEDVDDAKQTVPMDATCRRLLKKQHELKVAPPKVTNTNTNTNTTNQEPTTTITASSETNANGVKRPRWKYVAKVVNTRAMKKKKDTWKRIIPTYTNNNISNTLVEHDGELRVATVEEAKQVAWKPTREGNEYIYEGAKKAWLEKTEGGKSNVWGRAPITRASEATTKTKETKEEEIIKAKEEEQLREAEEEETMKGKEVVEEEESDSSSDDDDDKEEVVAEETTDDDDDDDDDDGKDGK